MDPKDPELVIDRLLCEIRGVKAHLKSVENELGRCGPDFHLMGLVGAIRALRTANRELSAENRKLKKELDKLLLTK